MKITDRDIKRFYNRISFGFGEDACWTWTGGISFKDGRGRFWLDGDTRSASVVSYIIRFGDVVGDKYVCHTCDNPPCVNPAHLFLGTDADNMRDMYKKGRRNVKGENSPMHKLNNQDAREIRKLYALGQTKRELAVKYKVCPSNIYHIVKRNTFTEA